MIFIVCSKIGQSSITTSLGRPEYSYYFLVKDFLPALEMVGTVHVVDDIAEVDRLYDRYRKDKENVVFISVSPPQLTPLFLRCPTVCLFAWEFHDAPDLPWHGNPQNDWSYVFERIAGAIACSQESAQAIRNIMGTDYPVVAIPAPVWDQYKELMPESGWLPIKSKRSFKFSGYAIDSHILGLSANGLVQHLPRPEKYIPTSPQVEKKSNRWQVTKSIYKGWWQAIKKRHEKRSAPLAGETPPSSTAGAQHLDECHFEFDGVVFCSVFNPSDGRKNWDDIVTAFCWAFRDKPDATLILKMTHHDLEYYRIFLLTLLSRLAPFSCRVVALHGYLSDEQYKDLIRLSDYYVNASTGEGLCLPIMEFMAGGKPPIAPCHTAMKDYLDSEVAFVVHSSLELACWSHDPTGKLKTRRHRLSWESLMQSYSLAYEQAIERPLSYQEMSKKAWYRMQSFSSVAGVQEHIAKFVSNKILSA